MELDSDQKKKLTGCICIFVVLPSVIMFACSWSVLEYNEVGLDYNSITKSIDPNHYTSGRYFLGLGHSFIKFPTNFQLVEFSTDHTASSGPLKGRTHDGLQVQLEISFQYKLRLNNRDLHDLYHSFGQDYNHVFMKAARDILVDMCAQYTANNFFTQRDAIAKNMTEGLTVWFDKHLYASIEYFQLRENVDLPDAFEQAIQATEVAKQDIEQAHRKTEQIKVSAETKVLQAEYNKKILLVQANATRRSIELQNQADIDVFTYTQEQLAFGFQKTQEMVGTVGDNGKDKMTPDELLQFMKIRSIQSIKPSNLIISLTDPTPKKTGNA